MRVWFRPHIGGEKWTVYLVAKTNKNLWDGDEQCDGRVFYDACKIYIRQDMSPEARTHTLLHELIHALMHVTGAEKAYGCEPGIDEAIVSAITPALHRLLKDFGFGFPHVA
jgi:hypothetical protein